MILVEVIQGRITTILFHTINLNLFKFLNQSIEFELYQNKWIENILTI